MNRAVAAVYAITISHDGHALNDSQKARLVDLVPALIAEINRLDEIARDPFVRGYIEARKQWVKP